MDRFVPLVTDLYRMVRGTEPDPTTDPERDGLKALATFVSEVSSKHAGARPEISASVETRLTTELRRSPSLFDAACKIVPDFPAPLGANRQVWLSYGGQVYHRYEDCPALIEGRTKAGRDASGGLSVMRVDQARSTPGYEVSGRRPCKICLP